MTKYMGLTGFILFVVGLFMLAIYGIQLFGTPPLDPRIISEIYTGLGVMGTIIGIALMVIHTKFSEILT